VTHLSHLFVHVTSLDATRHFYVELLRLEPLVDIDGYLRVGGGDGFHIGFEEREWADVGAPGVEIAVRVDDVDAVYARLREGGVQVGLPPDDQEWGTRQAWLYDPDGYRLSIFAPSSPTVEAAS
jgi:catechol 2,3-dioxygenase-like lactoylglutathione lyase family enzyme